MQSKKITSFVLLTLCSLLFSSSCSSFFNGVDVIITLKEEVQPIATLQVMDVATGDVPSNLTLTISGNDQASIVNFEGDADFSLNSQGIITFAVNSSTTNMENVAFDVAIDADEYVSSSVHIAYRGGEINSYSVSMISPNTLDTSEPLEGIHAVQRQVTNSANGITEDITQSASPEEAPTTTAYLKIAEGTQTFDESGNVISGDLETTFVYFDPTSEEALRSFPGGLDVNISGENGEAQSGIFTSAGMVNLTMLSGEQKVKTFSTPILVDVEINESIYNPAQGRVVREGDEVPYWSMSTATNQWVEEGVATIERNAETGKLYATMSVDHLSYWNLDWFTSTNCTEASSVIVSLSNLSEGYYPCGLENTATGEIFRYSWRYLKSNEIIQFYNAPQDANVRLHIFEDGLCNREAIATSEEFPMCGVVGRAINLNASTSIPDVVNFDLKAECINNPEISVRPNTPIYYKPSDCRYWQYLGYMTNGKLTTSQLTIGKSYQFWTVYSGEFNYLIPSAEIEYVYKYSDSPCQ